MKGVLSGYKVLDFGRYISGPFCAALLADMGANVIRVEPVEGSDDRYVMPIGEDESGGGAVHYHVNRGKRSIAIDTSTSEGRQVVERLIASADVVVANLPPKALTKLGLDYATLCAIRPDIILTTVNAYGLNGPYRDEIGFDCTGQALSGAMALTGTPEQPYRAAVSYVDYSTAISAALGTVSALLKRERTGQGEHVHCSLLKTALTITNSMLIEEASGARSRVATGNRSPISGPSDLFRTRDGWIMIQVIGNMMFRRWAQMVDQPELVDDPRFSDDQSRGDNGKALSAITAAWAADKTLEACMARAQAHRLPVTPMLSPGQAFTAPAIAQGEMLEYVSTRDNQQIPIVTTLCDFAVNGHDTPAPAPTLGAHTAAILKEAGFDAGTIDRLAATGTISETFMTSD
ncbi:CaiB/BaiF CoA transferase family protein [Sphingobium subterraneum]|uniref:Crotonobetainyl-CoA:carnitine CoA-transferase CaiB-like acyl-CoA transferase n=1 Tax=Sphingobium subterraneum TaxID=627688 RepID=A0A841J392_9SPHN|nr:CoA transferase [Sphingobium subterraneum]MBB6122978.1 crotonobetainyl-CoA:carnitine CoA-transferase CaiB-like acyl-CoA transferase [Sphingobium subterraneum]